MFIWGSGSSHYSRLPSLHWLHLYVRFSWTASRFSFEKIRARANRVDTAGPSISWQKPRKNSLPWIRAMERKVRREEKGRQRSRDRCELVDSIPWLRCLLERLSSDGRRSRRIDDRRSTRNFSQEERRRERNGQGVCGGILETVTFRDTIGPLRMNSQLSRKS